LLDSLSVNGSDLLTLRWTWHGNLHDTKINKAGKALVDVSRIPMTSFDLDHSDPHRPVRDYCSESGLWIENVDSPLVVHHYVGTYEQWAFRLDPRGVRTRDRFDTYARLNVSQDTTISHWLGDFVADVGIERARRLLSGAGRVEALSPTTFSSVLSDEAYDYLKFSNVTPTALFVVVIANFEEVASVSRFFACFFHGWRSIDEERSTRRKGDKKPIHHDIIIIVVIGSIAFWFSNRIGSSTCGLPPRPLRPVSATATAPRRGPPFYER
jgi:hypothetical protein